MTTAAACAVSAAATGSLPLTAGVAMGGFLIDVDHAADYFVFEGQRDLRPDTFLRYYLGGRVRRTVLVLHSYELMALLAALAWWLASPALAGYVLGASMHLALDIAYNGRLTPRNIWAFYSFGYRLAHRFEAATLLGPVRVGRLSRHFWAAFFHGVLPARARVIDSGRERCESSWSKMSRSSARSSTIP